MTVAMHQQPPPGSLRRRLTGRVANEEFAAQIDLVAKPLGAAVAGEEVAEFIAEDAGAAGLEDHDRHPGLDLRGQGRHHLLQILARLREKTGIVERASAADVTAR